MPNMKTYRRLVPDDIVPSYQFILPTTNQKILNLVGHSCIKTYNLQTMQIILTTWLNINAQITYVTQNDELIVALTNKKYIALIRQAQQQCQTIICDNIPSCAQISQDKSVIYIGCVNGYAYIIDTQTGEIIKQIDRIQTQSEQKLLKITSFNQIKYQNQDFYIIIQQQGLIYLYNKNFNRIDVLMLQSDIIQSFIEQNMIFVLTSQKQIYKIKINEQKLESEQVLNNLQTTDIYLFNNEITQQLMLIAQTQSFTDFYNIQNDKIIYKQRDAYLRLKNVFSLKNTIIYQNKDNSLNIQQSESFDDNQQIDIFCSKSKKQSIIAHPIDSEIIQYKDGQLYNVSSRTLSIINQCEIEGNIIKMINLPGNLFTLIFTQESIVFVLNRNSFQIIQAVKIIQNNTSSVQQFQSQIVIASEKILYFISLQYQNEEFIFQIVKKINCIENIQKIACSKKQIAYSTKSNFIYLIDYITGKQIKIFDFTLQINDFHFIGDDKILVASADKTLRVFGCQFAEMQSMIKLQHPIYHLAQFADTSLFLVSDTLNMSVYDCQGKPQLIYQLGKRGQQVYTDSQSGLQYLNHQSQVSDLEVGNTCRYAVTVGQDGLIQWIVDEQDILVGPEEDNDNMGMEQEELEKIDIYDQIESIINENNITSIVNMINSTNKQKLSMCIRQMRSETVNTFLNQLNIIINNQALNSNSIVSLDTIFALIRLVKNQYNIKFQQQNVQKIVENAHQQLVQALGEIDSLEFIRQL